MSSGVRHILTGTPFVAALYVKNVLPLIHFTFLASHWPSTFVRPFFFSTFFIAQIYHRTNLFQTRAPFAPSFPPYCIVPCLRLIPSLLASLQPSHTHPMHHNPHDSFPLKSRSLHPPPQRSPFRRPTLLLFQSFLAESSFLPSPSHTLSFSSITITTTYPIKSIRLHPLPSNKHPPIFINMTVGCTRMAVDFLLDTPSIPTSPPATVPGTPVSSTTELSDVPTIPNTLPSTSSELTVTPAPSARTYTPAPGILSLAHAAEMAAAAAAARPRQQAPYSPVSTNSASTIEDQITALNIAPHSRSAAVLAPNVLQPTLIQPRPLSSSVIHPSFQTRPAQSFVALTPTPQLSQHQLADTPANVQPQQQQSSQLHQAALLVANFSQRGSSASRLLTCATCGDTFNQKVRFLYHLLKAHGTRTYETHTILPCDKCSSAFLRNTDRSKHDACVHQKLRPYHCNAPNCTSSFFFAKDLSKHRSTVHLRHKPFPCSICNKAFGKREHMTSHVKRVHQKLRPFKCEVCDIRLASKYNLQGHLKTAAHAAAEAVANQKAEEQRQSAERTA